MAVSFFFFFPSSFKKKDFRWTGEQFVGRDGGCKLQQPKKKKKGKMPKREKREREREGRRVALPSRKCQTILCIKKQEIN